MAHGCPRGSKTKNHEGRLTLSRETGSVSETIMRPERHNVGELDDGKPWKLREQM